MSQDMLDCRALLG